MGLWIKNADGTIERTAGGGADGVDGQPGVDGNMWHVGSGAPAPTLGEPGDYYLDGEDGWVYVKRNDGSWTNLYVNLTGPSGDDAGEHDHDYAPTSHTHNYAAPHDHPYAASSHTHSYSPTNHTHSYAPTSHTHSYAPTSHNHSYLPLSGGTVSGNTTIKSDDLRIQKKGNGALSGSLWMDHNWIRIKENNGVYFDKHGGGLHMTDSKWVQAFGNKGLMANGGFASTGITAQSSMSGNQYLLWNTALTSFGRYTSTRAIKERIAPMSASVDPGAIIDALNPVTFIARHVGDEVETAEAKADRESSIIYGFIAEEVCDIDKEFGACLGTYEPNDTDGACDKPSSWGLHPMVAVLVAAAKSQRDTIADLTARIETLEGQTRL
jgi:hypothetical protein